jgi:hypothetical protein
MSAIRRSKKSTQASHNPVVFVAPPPAGTTVPPVPQGFEPAKNNAFRGAFPKTAEQDVMADVVKELERFGDYAETFGKTAPPLATVLQTFDGATQWASLRKKADAFSDYCLTQTGKSWKHVRKYLASMGPAFQLAVAGDPTVGARYPALVQFFASKKQSAQKAADARRLNVQSTARGEMAFAGEAGKRRERVAAKKALAEKLASDKAPSQPVASSGATSTNGTTGTAKPAVNVGSVGSA